MADNITKKLDEVIETRLSEFEYYDLDNEHIGDAVNAIEKLYKLRIDESKVTEELEEKRIALEKEKAEIQQSIYNALGYMHRLEKEVGIKSKTYTYIYDQTICENELSSKFVIEKEDI